MKPNAMNRLETLERSRGHNRSRIRGIERVGVAPGRGQRDLDFYRDQDGNLWSRESVETIEAFRERVTAEAIAKAQPKIARIIGYQTLEEAEEYSRLG